MFENKATLNPKLLVADEPRLSFSNSLKAI